MARWGVIGTGFIARRFVEAIRDMNFSCPGAAHTTKGCQVHAVVSRTDESATAFANEFKIPSVFSDAKSLVQSDSIDAIYIASPHAAHFSQARLAILAGKSVLCEKPMCLYPHHTEHLIELATRGQILLMEAMKLEFNPIFHRVLALLEKDAIGVPRILHAEFCFKAEPSRARLFDRKLGGGSLFDVGTYLIWLVMRLFGPISEFNTKARFRKGIEVELAVSCIHENGVKCHLLSSITNDRESALRIIGTDGYLEVPMFWQATSCSLVRRANCINILADSSRKDKSYEHQIEHFHSCLASGLAESAVVPHATSLAVARVLDDIRRKAGISF